MGSLLLVAVSLPSFLMHLLILSLRFPSVIPSSIMHLGNETDRLALLAFRAEITNDPTGALTSSWNHSAHFCQWLGVACGSRHQRVIKLDLNSLQLTGSISPHIGNLSFLQILLLYNNSFTHIIPPEIGNLQRLKALWLTNNSISGQFPTTISNCTNLVHLHLDGNKLQGRIPANIGSLTKLQVMDIPRNNLIGNLPPSLGNLSSLKLFSVNENWISGHIPDSLAQLENLHAVGLGENRLFGTIPPSIFNRSSITVFNVGGNKIEGSLPQDFGNTLPSLEYFNIGFNLLTGSFPASVWNASKLEVLFIEQNKFIGEMPSSEGSPKFLRATSLEGNDLGSGGKNDSVFLSSLANASSLRFLILTDNNFGGVLPKSICNLSTSLLALGLGRNNFFGSIPSEIGNLVSLEMVTLSKNQFSGEVPPSFGKLQHLHDLDLSFNKLSGNIPQDFGNLTLLNKLLLEENNFSGNIPPTLGNCQSLNRVNLTRNKLSGTLPPQLFSLQILWTMDLSHNHLSGSFPSEVGNMKNIERLDVSDNMMSGEIPSTLGGCVKLEFLSIGGNNFQGAIPSSFSNLKGIATLDLSRNNLSGKIPDYLGNLGSLLKLNLSSNDFEGQVPKMGVFNNASAVSLQGNIKLCGGIPELHLPSCSSQGSKRRISSLLSLKLIIPIGFGILGSTLVLCFGILYWFRKKSTLPPNKILESQFSKVSYQNLFHATNGFSPTNLIGVGSFSSVYKGTFDQGRTVVAVKVLNVQSRGASKTFKAECEALRVIKHRNLVKVITACSSIDYQGNDFKALVYEFMVNGSLEEWLHPNKNDSEAYEDYSQSLTLLQRLNITIDVAAALDYLHHHCFESIAHCDVKPSNVLLDAKMIAHVGDFGLARFLQQARNDIVSNQSSSLGIVRGTVGYTAPEYGMGNEVSTLGDVYSYGILLLEMFTGKKPTDEMFSASMNLHSFIKVALPYQVATVVDPKLLEQKGEEDEASSSINIMRNQSHIRGNKIEECLISLFTIGVACSEDLPGNRMNIRDVLTQLHAIKKNLTNDGARQGNRARLPI